MSIPVRLFELKNTPFPSIWEGLFDRKRSIPWFPVTLLGVAESDAVALMSSDARGAFESLPKPQPPRSLLVFATCVSKLKGGPESCSS
jgi:hypothetical protein